MNKIFLFIATILLFAGCKQSFLDTQNLTQKSSDNFPGSYVEADQAVTGIYAILPTGFSGLASPLLISEILSDVAPTSGPGVVVPQPAPLSSPALPTSVPRRFDDIDFVST